MGQPNLKSWRISTFHCSGTWKPILDHSNNYFVENSTIHTLQLTVKRPEKRPYRLLLLTGFFITLRLLAWQARTPAQMASQEASLTRSVRQPPHQLNLLSASQKRLVARPQQQILSIQTEQNHSPAPCLSAKGVDPRRSSATRPSLPVDHVSRRASHVSASIRPREEK